MTFAQRFLLALFIILAIMFALAVLGYYSGGWQDDPAPFMSRLMDLASAQSRPELCMDPDTRERVREIMFKALDESLNDRIGDLMAVWLRDETGQPARAQKGLENALRAYYHARAQALKFNPPECAG